MQKGNNGGCPAIEHGNYQRARRTGAKPRDAEPIIRETTIIGSVIFKQKD
jgi:hypothetical protein